MLPHLGDAAADVDDALFAPVGGAELAAAAFAPAAPPSEDRTRDATALAVLFAARGGGAKAALPKIAVALERARRGTASPTGGANGEQDAAVEQLDADTGEVVARWPSGAAAARRFGHNVTKGLRGERRTAGGFAWRRAHGEQAEETEEEQQASGRPAQQRRRAAMGEVLRHYYAVFKVACKPFCGVGLARGREEGGRAPRRKAPRRTTECNELRPPLPPAVSKPSAAHAGRKTGVRRQCTSSFLRAATAERPNADADTTAIEASRVKRSRHDADADVDAVAVADADADVDVDADTHSGDAETSANADADTTTIAASCAKRSRHDADADADAVAAADADADADTHGGDADTRANVDADAMTTMTARAKRARRPRELLNIADPSERLAEGAAVRAQFADGKWYDARIARYLQQVSAYLVEWKDGGQSEVDNRSVRAV